MKRLGITMLLLALMVSTGCTRTGAQSGTQAATQPTTQLAPVGRFADMRESGEHCTGYSLELWKLEGKLYGLFHACAGLAGDVPTGVIENASFDEGTHALKFEAKLTVGSDFHGGVQTPSKDVFTFEGSMETAEISGNLKHEDRVYDHKTPAVVSVHLRRQKNDLNSYPNVEAWKAANAVLLQNTGPKW